MVKKIFVTVLILMLTTIGAYAANGKKSKGPFKTKFIQVQTKDKFLICATLTYPKNKIKKAHYPTVILLHSLGYTSGQWGNLTRYLAKHGYAVLAVDLRGHGISNKDSKFKVHSWEYFKPKMFAMYPDDVIDIIKQTQKTTKKADFNHYAIIGGDIGANTAVLVASKMPVKPKALVLLSPSRNIKGLYIPIAMTELGSTPILTMSSKNDRITTYEEVILKRFSQSTYVINNVNTNSTGMMIVQTYPQSINTIFWFIYKRMRPLKVIH